MLLGLSIGDAGFFLLLLDSLSVRGIDFFLFLTIFLSIVGDKSGSGFGDFSADSSSSS